MDFVTPVANGIFSLYDAVASRISLVVGSDKRVRLLVTVLGELRDVKDDLRRRIKKADLQRLTCMSQVRRWIQRLQVIEAEASSIIEDLTEKRSCFWCCTAKCKSIYKRSMRLPKKIQEVDGLKKRGSF
ncbi:hypothetical protein CDL15_Pgr004356 [Punica granatum]|uniref:Uncharacterized protein n=1 Tax=Punica granatum TaxID=22663 RepID=A0A218XFC8_PUNGR|nr:hypothetical protein CDL15_Pgr004356 [Punica granatum]PKI53633.1 hypothetical protein CRG98_025966 [Punica granatum]